MASSLNPGKPAYFTRKEVARVLGVHPSTVYRWAKAKRLPEPIVPALTGRSGKFPKLLNGWRVAKSLVGSKR